MNSHTIMMIARYGGGVKAAACESNPVTLDCEDRDMSHKYPPGLVPSADRGCRIGVDGPVTGPEKLFKRRHRRLVVCS